MTTTTKTTMNATTMTTMTKTVTTVATGTTNFGFHVKKVWFVSEECADVKSIKSFKLFVDELDDDSKDLNLFKQANEQIIAKTEM